MRKQIERKNKSKIWKRKRKKKQNTQQKAQISKAQKVIGEINKTKKKQGKRILNEKLRTSENEKCSEETKKNWQNGKNVKITKKKLVN